MIRRVGSNPTAVIHAALRPAERLPLLLDPPPECLSAWRDTAFLCCDLSFMTTVYTETLCNSLDLSLFVGQTPSCSGM